MKNALQLFFLFCCTLNGLQAQTSQKANLAFKNNTYDVFILRCDSGYSQKLALVENRSGLPEEEYFNSLAGGAPFFCITASIIDSLCMPLGFYLHDGKQTHPVNNNSGSGNFYLKPNGILVSDSLGVTITDAAAYNGARGITGIQSGPMLVIDGNIHPVFNPDSQNRYTRCGAGIYEANNQSFLVFAKSQLPVSLYDFASLFREKYNCTNAMNLESGTYCSMHLPSIQKTYSQNTTICRYLFISL